MKGGRPVGIITTPQTTLEASGHLKLKMYLVLVGTSVRRHNFLYRGLYRPRSETREDNWKYRQNPTGFFIVPTIVLWIPAFIFAISAEDHKVDEEKAITTFGCCNNRVGCFLLASYSSSGIDSLS